MRLSKLALAVGVSTALAGGQVFGLGLGEIKLNSKLNEPLDASIRLLDTKGLSSEEILVQLGSQDDFQRAGIDRPYFLTDLKFKVVTSGPGGPYLQVNSSKLVNEPYLNFLVEAQWPAGRILREYTVLLDLPIFSEPQAAPVNQSSVSSRPPQRAAVSEPARPAQRPASRSTSSVPRASGGVYGPVSSSDTLWEIALKVRPSREFSVHQTMMALQAANPDAFINGNINLLKKGKVLRVPDAEELRAINQRRAVSEVAVQNTEWKSFQAGDTSETLDARSFSRQTELVSSEPEGRLQISSQSADSDGSVSGGSDSNSGALQSELSSALEELDKSQRENSELKSRVSELEEQINTMERLVELSNEELRALQLAAAAQNQSDESGSNREDSQSYYDQDVSDDGELVPGSVADNVDAALAADEAGIADSVDAPDAAEQSIATDQFVDNDTVANETAAEQAVTPTPPAVIQPNNNRNVVTTSRPPEKSFMDVLMDNILWVAGGIVALLGAIFVLLRRRDTEESFDPMEDASESSFFDESSEIDQIAEDIESLEPETFAEDVEEGLDEIADEEIEDLIEEEPVSAESQTDDVVAEADIYIAYGKHDQAEAMLIKALDNDPEDNEARLKLMEVYSETGEVAKFDEQYDRVTTVGDQDSIDRADHMKAQFADVADFTDSDSIQDEEVDAEPEFDLPGFEGDLDLGADADSEDLEEFDLDLGSDGDLDLSEDDSDFGVIDDASESTDEEFSLDLDEEELATDDLSFDLADEGSLESDLDFEVGDLESSEGDLEFSLDDLDDSTSSNDSDSDLELALDDVSSEEGDMSLAFESTTGDSDIVDSDDLTLDDSEDDLLDDSELDLDMDDLDVDIDDISIGEDLVAEEFGEDSDDLSLDSDLSLDMQEDGLGEDSLAEDDADLEDLSLESDVLSSADSDDEFKIDLEDSELVTGLIDQELEDISLESDLEVPELDSLADEGIDLDFDEQESLENSELVTGVLDQDLDSVELDLEDLEDLDVESSENSTDELSSLDEVAAESDLEESLSLVGDLETEVFDELSDSELELSDDDLDLSLDEAPDLDLSSIEDLELPEDGLSIGDDVTEAAESELSAELAEQIDVSDEESFESALDDIPELNSPVETDAADEVVESPFDEEVDLDFLADADEASTKLDLARAYIDMGDRDGARDILQEVVSEGNDAQRQDAENLLARID